MQNIITNTQIFDIVPGNDFELIRNYDLDENVTIASATLAVKEQMVTPLNADTGPGTLIPIEVSVNDAAGDDGIISDQGTTSQVCSLTFLLNNIITGYLDSDTMYFFQVQLETTEDTPQKYPAESGVIVTGTRMI